MNIRLRLTASLLLTVAFAGWMWARYKNPPPPSVVHTGIRPKALYLPSPAGNQAPAFAQVLHQVQMPADAVQEQQDKTIAGDPFLDPLTIRDLVAALDGSLRFLDGQRARQAFQDSPADRSEFYHYALAHLRRGYGPSPSHDELQARVAALRFFELSAHFSPDDCRDILASLPQQWERAPGEQQKKNVEVDTYELAQVCSRANHELVEAAIAETRLDQIKRAMQMGLSYVHES